MKLLSTIQMREADLHTIKNEPISSLRLMERAATKFCSVLQVRYPNKPKVHIICGLGNNGGDGLAIARILNACFWKIKVSILSYGAKPTVDFESNFKRLPTNISSHEVKTIEELSIEKDSIIIDAIFGSGLNRPIEGRLAKWIHHINNSLNEIIAVDIPSGLFSEIDSSKNTVIKAKHTFSFQLAKLAFMFPQNNKYVGSWELIDIKLDADFIKNSESKKRYITREYIMGIIKQTSKFFHKGNKGHALIIGGSKGKMGACILNSKACIRTGSGLVTAHVPNCGVEILQTAIPEVMVSIDENEDLFSEIRNLNFENYKSIGIGSGLGASLKTSKALSKVLKTVDYPIVLDADALNILSKNKKWMKFIPKNSILTPHPKEFERLVGKWSNDFERLEKQMDLSKKLNVFLVLKGAHTSITTPEGETYFNSTGNPGMATAGSGDVLTGIVTSLLAQSYNPKEAAILGVYLHGLAGDISNTKFGENAMIASDIIENIGSAYLSLRKDIN